MMSGMRQAGMQKTKWERLLSEDAGARNGRKAELYIRQWGDGRPNEYAVTVDVKGGENLVFELGHEYQPLFTLTFGEAWKAMGALLALSGEKLGTGFIMLTGSYACAKKAGAEFMLEFRPSG